MEKIVFNESILAYLQDVVFVLFKEDYFSYAENSRNYVDKIIEFVISEIEFFPLKSAPIPLKYLGSNYIFYKSNSRTTWYIFFEKANNNYLITRILNNHCQEAKFIESSAIN